MLLLDEPLGALDAKLRKVLQIELKALQEKVGITFVYVTHDQEEALTMADRLAVMNEGRIEQIGSPKEVYEEPATAFVASFLGVSNMLDAEAIATEPDGRCRVKVGDLQLLASCGHTGAKGTVKIVVRPERVRVEAPRRTGENRLPGKVERVVYAGAISQLVVTLDRGAPDPVHAGQRRGGRLLRSGNAGLRASAVRGPARARCPRRSGERRRGDTDRSLVRPGGG